MIDYDQFRSLPAMFLEIAARHGDKPFLWAKRDGKYHSLNWAETARAVNRLARGLVALGVEQHDGDVAGGDRGLGKVDVRG